MIKFRKITLILLIIIFTMMMFSPFSSAATSQNSFTTVTLTVGSTKILVDDTVIVGEKPFITGNVLYFPLRPVLEAFGAEVNWLGNGKLSILFQDSSVELSVGNAICKTNQIDTKLSAAPVIKNGTIMAPVDLASQCFNIVVSKGKTSQTTLTLKSDGSLSDLSFLTGGLNSPRIGNSYFGWSVNVLKGSRIVSKSFSSNDIYIENEQHNVDFEVYSTISNGKSIKDYYSEIIDDPSTVINADILDSRLNTTSKPAYIELLYTDMYEQAVYQRIYESDKYFHTVAFTSYIETNPEKLKSNKSLNDVFNSFKINFKGSLSDTSDISNVKNGLAKYSNYVTSDLTGKKFFTWEMSTAPEWSIFQLDYEYGADPYVTEIGIDTQDFKEKVSVEISSANGTTDINKYGKDMLDYNNSNYNPTLYKLVKSQFNQINGLKSFNMVYEVKMGTKNYKYNENYIISGGLIFDITFKSDVKTFDERIDSYQKMLDTFKPLQKENADLSAELERYIYSLEKDRVGKDDSVVVCENKTYNWQVSIPGNWLRKSTSGDNPESFENSRTGGLFIIESTVKKSGTTSNTDEDRFKTMKSYIGIGLVFVKLDTLQQNGQTNKIYKYRFDSEDTDRHEDVYFYIYEGSTSSYCVMSTLPDICSTTTNLKSMNDILKSFIITNAVK